MARRFSRILIPSLLFCMAAGAAVAAPPTKPAKKPAAEKAKCPVCGMFLAKSPTAKSTTAVRLKKGDPVMYCCSHCKMPASVLVKAPAPKMKK